MFRILLVLIGLTLLSDARIKENIQQCDKRYGTPVEAKHNPVENTVKRIYVTSGKVRILAYFHEDVCFHIAYFSNVSRRGVFMSLPFKPADLIKKMGFTKLKASGSQKNNYNMVQGSLTFIYTHMSLMILDSSVQKAIQKNREAYKKGKRGNALSNL